MKHAHNLSKFQQRRALERHEQERHERARARTERLRKMRATANIFEHDLADEPSPEEDKQ